MMPSLFDIYEKLFSKIFSIEEISKDSIFRLATYRYKGKKIRLTDGTTVDRGDKIAEIHLRNDIKRMVGKGGIDFLIAAKLKERTSSSLSSLAYLFEKEPKFKKIKAIKANTLIADLAEKLGFESMEIENKVLRMILSRYQGWLLKRSSLSERRSKNHKVARTVWISTERLINLYGKSNGLRPAAGE